MSSLSTTLYDSSLSTSEHPQFAPPTTPSRSPYKDAGHRRSPTKLLRPTKAVPDYDEFQALLSSDITTAAEKELASRVVRAAEKLKEWCVEIEQWGWSGSFEASPGRRGHLDGNSDDDRFSGSLPLEQVEAYESRLDRIDDELTTLEVDELKEQILGIHIGRSRPSSSYSSQSFSNLTLYDDFQLFVTETLIHTLPHHAKLKQHLKAWSARLAVLAEIPSFLRGSYRFFTILNGAYRPLQYPLDPLAEPDALSIVERQLTTAQHELREIVGEIGKQLDRMLDTLEESDDRLPDNWIDKFEADETEYTNWSYEAEKKLFQLRMLETALANNHDTSAFAPPDPDPPTIEIPVISGRVEPLAAGQTLIGDSYKEREVTDVVKGSDILASKSIVTHTNGIASSTVLAPTLLPSESKGVTDELVKGFETLPDKSIVTHPDGTGDRGHPSVTISPVQDENDAAGLDGPPGALLQQYIPAPVAAEEHVRETPDEAPVEALPTLETLARTITEDHASEIMTEAPADAPQSLEAPPPTISADRELEILTEPPADALPSLEIPGSAIAKDHTSEIIVETPVDALQGLDAPPPVIVVKRDPGILTEAPAALPETSLIGLVTAAHLSETVNMSGDPANMARELNGSFSAPIEEWIMIDTDETHKKESMIDMDKAHMKESMIRDVTTAFVPTSQHQGRPGVSEGPADALRKLEGSVPATIEDSGIGLNDSVALQGELLMESTEDARLLVASDVWSSDEDGAENGNGEVEGPVAVDLSFLGTDPAEATALHHLPASFVRRASVTSIESFSRDKVKTVTLSRRNSVNLSRRNSGSTIGSVNDTPPPLPTAPSTRSVDSTKPKILFGTHSASPLSAFTESSSEECEISRPMTPSFQAKNLSATSLFSSARSDGSEEREAPEDSPLLRVRERTAAHAPKPPLNWAMRKRRGVDADTLLDTRSVSSPFSDTESKSSTGASPTSTKSPMSPMVPFEEHLSSLLDSLPAPIKLKSSSSHNAPTITSKNRNTTASQPYQPRSRAPTPALSPLPTLTLAPAEESSTRRSGVNDPEIKVYNLISGKDKPIKLFVRRVGENGERIMVRVGGGWCDLGEYLRTYAEHHGRRTASDGKIEVHSLGLPEPGAILPIPTATPTSRRTSLVSSIGSSAIAGTTLPASRSASRAGAASPALFDTPPKLGTPKIVNDEYLGTPQTAGSVTSIGSRKTSNIWEGDSSTGTGLMGPAVAKKRDQALSEEKTRWVEGVVEQAKRTVGKNSEKGGTRRVFLKGKGPE